MNKNYLNLKEWLDKNIPPKFLAFVNLTARWRGRGSEPWEVLGGSTRGSLNPFFSLGSVFKAIVGKCIV